MRIAAFSMTPLIPDRVMGGAQKQLYTVVMHLAEQGHLVTVLCSRRPPDAAAPFQWHHNATVVPIFRFKQPYPEPYATPIFNIANAIQDLGEYLSQADVFYSHDGGFIFPYTYQTTPTVTSLRSVLFSETLQSAFLFQGDDLILISNYQRDVILNTVGRFFPDLAQRTHVIYNGLDFDTFRPTAPDAALTHIEGLNPAKHAVVLYPHRPEREKGILETIEVARRLVDDHNINNLRVLVPRWIESALSPGDKAFYDDVTGRIRDYGLTETFVFHPWMTQSQMPAYYSLGAVTLAVGSYVETFGNVPYESLACGTPAIVARVGPARELLPDDLLHKVDFGDVDEAARIAASIINTRERTSAATLTYLKTHFQQDDMVAAYANVILNASKRPPMPYRHTPLTAQTRFRQAPWVTLNSAGHLYHDLHAVTADDAALLTAADEMGAGAAPGDNRWQQWQAWYRDGWIVPLMPERGGSVTNVIYLSIGSNTAAAYNLRQIVQKLREWVTVVNISPVYAGQDASGGEGVYFNAALCAETPLSPAELKRQVLNPIENLLGRTRNTSAVTADIDIVLVNEDVLTYDGRDIPDPDVLTTAHVAVPLADIAPNYVHPVEGRTLADVAATVADRDALTRRDDITL